MSLLRPAMFGVALLLGLLTMPAAVASEYGYLRIVVEQPNPAHRTDVVLRLNGQRLVAFSHSRTTALEREIPREFLANGRSTPLTSDYGGLQEDCRFDYRIEYSLDRKAWTNLGNYEAPTSGVSTSLPIGICDGELCSGNSAIHSQLEKLADERWRRNGEALRAWLQAGVDAEDRRLREAAESLAAAAVREPDVAALLQQLEDSGDSLGLHDVANDLAPPVSDALQVMDRRIEEAIGAGNVGQLSARLITEEQFFRNCQQQPPFYQSLCARYGGLAPLISMGLVLHMAASSDPEGMREWFEQRVFVPGAGAALEDRAAQIADMRARLQLAVDAQRAQTSFAALSDAARLGTSFTPFNDVLDLCEAVTGREFCTGRELEPAQRLFAGLGVIGGNRALWEQLSAEIRLAISAGFDDPATMRRLTERVAAESQLIDPRGLGHVLLGEYERGATTATTLRTGMHTDDAVQVLLVRWRAEGTPIELKRVFDAADLPRAIPRDGGALHYIGADGVGVYQFGRDRFPTTAIAERNISIIAGSDGDRIIQGAKSVFPSFWSVDTIVDALIAVRNQPLTRSDDGRILRGFYRGVEIRVRVDDTGRILSAYPVAR